MQPKNYEDNFFEYHLQGAIASAEEVIPIVQEYIKPDSLIDIGCGVGAWLKVWDQNGVKEIMGIDGNYVDKKQLQIKEKNFHSCNLEEGYKSNRKFQLVTCLEVAEHLPAKYAENFVDSLCALGDVILFSAAIPGQEGTMHINEQYPEYWADIFARNNYVPVDCLRQKVWNNEKIQWWYRQNIIFFVKETALANYPGLKEAYGNTNGKCPSLVHPELLAYKAKKAEYFEKLANSPAQVLKNAVGNFFKAKSIGQ